MVQQPANHLFHSSTRPRTRQLATALSRWRESLRHVVTLVADFADSGEWVATGATTAAHWVAYAADVEVSTAREWIRVGRRLNVLPHLAAAFAADHISYSKVRTLTRFADADTEIELLALAQQVPAGRLTGAIAVRITRRSDEAELSQHQYQQRSVTWRTEPDGMISFSMRLEPLVAAQLCAHITTRVMRSRPQPEHVEEWPTVAQQQADAFADLLTGGSTGSTDIEIVLHVRADGTTLDDGSPIAGTIVERLAPNSFLRALVHDAAARPINASSRRRHPTTRQQRVVKERDRCCVDCGTDQLLVYDHVPDFAITGHTTTNELELRCAPCHHRRHAA